MELHCGIDLYSNNSVVNVLDEQDRTMFAKRLPNDLAAIVARTAMSARALPGVAVESTYNWYWLVEGLFEPSTTYQRQAFLRSCLPTIRRLFRKSRSRMKQVAQVNSTW